MVKGILFAAICALSSAGFATESDYVKNTCTGEIEHVNSDRTRTDCYYDFASIEYDFAKKWYECITQALYYSMLNDNYAVCRLIVLDDKDLKYVSRARKIQRHFNLPVYISVIK